MIDKENNLNNHYIVFGNDFAKSCNVMQKGLNVSDNFKSCVLTNDCYFRMFKKC